MSTVLGADATNPTSPYAPFCGVDQSCYDAAIAAAYDPQTALGLCGTLCPYTPAPGTNCTDTGCTSCDSSCSPPVCCDATGACSGGCDGQGSCWCPPSVGAIAGGVGSTVAAALRPLLPIALVLGAALIAVEVLARR